MALILDDIVLAPCRFVAWIGEKLHQQAVSEMTDESALQQRLLDLQMEFELGKIGESEYRSQEDAVMRRLDEIRKYTESQQQGQ